MSRRRLLATLALLERRALGRLLRLRRLGLSIARQRSSAVHECARARHDVLKGGLVTGLRCVWLQAHTELAGAKAASLAAAHEQLLVQARTVGAQRHRWQRLHRGLTRRTAHASQGCAAK